MTSTRITAGQIEVTCPACRARHFVYPSQHRERNCCSRTCLGKWRTQQVGPKAAHWQGGEKIERGRAFWHLPWHHRADSKGYVRRAIVVAELKLRRAIMAGEVVHHEDGDPLNDHPDNLTVYPSQAEHSREHGRRRTPEQTDAMRAARGQR